MKIVKNNFVRILILSLSIFSCVQKNSKTVKKQYRIDFLTEEYNTTKHDSNTVKSKNMLVLKNISKENIIIKRIDTVTTNSFFESEFNSKFSYPYIKGFNKIISYQLLIKINNSSIPVNFLQIIFNTNKKAKIVFSKLKKEAVNKEGKLPGLTYENDIVTMDNNTIYWFNTPCGMSIKNTIIYYKKLMREINGDKIIHCKCGKISCEIKNSLN